MSTVRSFWGERFHKLFWSGVIIAVIVCFTPLAITEAHGVETWTKEEGVPIEQAASVCTIQLPGGNYRMYFNYGGESQIGCAISDDGLIFTFEQVVLVAGPAPPYWYDANRASDPCILQLGDGSLRMIYVGRDNSPDQNYRYCSAVSVDGLTWTKQGPILSVPDTFVGTEDAIQITDGGPDNGKWRLYYVEGEQPGGGLASAISTDDTGGGTWTRDEGYRLSPHPYLDPDIIGLADGTYKLYYVAPPPGQEYGNLRVYSAVSDDGLNFTKESGYRMVADEEDGMCVDPDVIGLPDGSYRMYYQLCAGPELTGMRSAIADTPDITSITPSSGYNTGTVQITDLKGFVFMTGAQVKLKKGETEIEATGENVVNNMKITCQFNLAGKTAGSWDVYVDNLDGGSGSLAGGFTIKNPAPTINSITPSSGINDGTVTITNLAGTGFLSGAAVKLKKSGQSDITGTNVSVSSSTKITCKLDLTGAAEGAWNVYVRNSDGQSATKTGAFTVNEAEPEPEETAPSIGAVTPALGPPGTEITITGENFGSTQGSSKVTIGGVEATVVYWSDTKIVVIVPEGTSGGGVMVITSSGSSPEDKTFTVTSPTWYLAEGTTDWGFDCYISIENPNSEAVTAKVTYMTDEGPIERENITLPPLSQTTLDPRSDLGNKDFSTKVECIEGHTIAVDRTMTWTGPGAASPETHSSVGVTSPDRTWYLPEGSSDWNFECWLLIQNPNDGEANCQVTYMIEGEGPQTLTKVVGPNSRSTYNMESDIGKKDASIKVESDIPVIPERAMYRNNRREGHDSTGTTSPANDYFLAEGTTAWGFTTYVLVQNPNDSPANVTITYMTAEGPVPQPAFNMPANSRKTIKVNDVLPDKDFSTKVSADVPIIAERAMYWGEGTDLGEACHDSIGMNEAHTTFYLPDGETGNGKETWTLVQNPNDTSVEVEITYLTPDGTGNQTFTDTVPANSRKTYNMVEKIPGLRASILVTSRTAGNQIMVERAMYSNNRGAGTDTIGGYSD